jgi:hypothetical protein
MTGYVKTTINNQFIEYPYGAEQLVRDNPGFGYTYNSDFLEIFPTTDAYNINGYRLHYVEIDPEPTYDVKTQTIYRVPDPIIRDGKWLFSWVIKDLTPEQIANMEKMNQDPLGRPLGEGYDR